MDKHEALYRAHKEARFNGRGYAFAVYSPPNRNFPEGLWQVTDRKPMLRDRDWVVIECSDDGREFIG